MSFKHRNGETPDHVDSSQSNAEHLGMGVFSDSTKKKAPVDTVAIKGRIANDQSTMKDINDRAIKSTGRNNFDSGNERREALSKLSNGYQLAKDRVKANTDTLDQARAKKIPAKP